VRTPPVCCARTFDQNPNHFQKSLRLKRQRLADRKQATETVALQSESGTHASGVLRLERKRPACS